MDNTLFNDLMEALHEVEEYQKGNIELKTRTVTLPDHDISLKYSKLPDEDKRTITVIIDKMLIANAKV